MSNQFDDFKLPANAYAAFDATSLRDLIIQRLNTQSVFTDQNFEGSNISSIIDIVAYSYHVLLFYMNQTSSESNFSTASLYENINKIVKLLNYKPIGNQTPILTFTATADANLPANVYTIPRYSYFTLNGINYSFNNDTTFSVPNGGGLLPTLFEQTTLFQGNYKEYPIYTAQGSPFESLNLVLVDASGNNLIIDHFNIDVYVKDNTQLSPVWVKWTSTPSLFLETVDAKKYEIRLNENGRYEIKFGNGITGSQLNAGDSVAVYYLQSDGASGEVGANTLKGNQLFFYNTIQYQNILNDTILFSANKLTPLISNLISFNNTYASTKYTTIESVDSIKINALNTFQNQYRLLTTSDIQNFIKNNYSNIICSVKAVNNEDYLSGHVQYLFNQGIDKPNKDSRVLINQLKFASPCNFNNIYVYAVPNIVTETSLTTRINYLNAAQKQLINSAINPYKIATSNIVINDPVYISIDIGVVGENESLTTDTAINTKLQITTKKNINTSSSQILQQVYNIFTNYFSTTQDNLGKLINISDISSQILSINGIKSIQTVNGSVAKPGISLLVYNPIYYNTDIQIIQQNLQLEYFQYPYLNNMLDFINKIEVISE